MGISGILAIIKIEDFFHLLGEDNLEEIEQHYKSELDKEISNNEI